MQTTRVVLPSLAWYRGVTTEFVELLSSSLLTFTLLTHADNPGGLTRLELVKRRCCEVHGIVVVVVDTYIIDPCGQFGWSYRHY